MPPWDRGIRIYSNGLGHMTSMAAVFIYGKSLKNLLLKNQRPMTFYVRMLHWILKYYQIYSNDDPGLTSTYFTARSNLVHSAFIWEKGKTMDI